MTIDFQPYNCDLQVVVITGASSGLGEALAHSFYMAGCKVVLAARRKDELERVRNDLLEIHSVWKWLESARRWAVNQLYNICHVVFFSLNDFSKGQRIHPWSFRLTCPIWIVWRKKWRAFWEYSVTSIYWWITAVSVFERMWCPPPLMLISK